MAATQTLLPAFDAAYWQARYATPGRAGWDAGRITPPLQAYFDQLLAIQQLRILIPGAGRAYEAEYLHQLGGEHVVVADLAPEPLAELATRVPSFPKENLWLTNFFALLPTQTFDLLIEQTFFCALHPALRPAYAQQCARLLRPGGKLVGLLFDTDFPNASEPPLGVAGPSTRLTLSRISTSFISTRRTTPCPPARAASYLFA